MPDLITACRAWAGFSLDQLCAHCRRPFYCAGALPVCYGCRRDAIRERLLATLEARYLALTSPVESKPVQISLVRTLTDDVSPAQSRLV